LHHLQQRKSKKNKKNHSVSSHTKFFAHQLRFVSQKKEIPCKHIPSQKKCVLTFKIKPKMLRRFSSSSPIITSISHRTFYHGGGNNNNSNNNDNSNQQQQFQGNPATPTWKRQVSNSAIEEARMRQNQYNQYNNNNNASTNQQQQQQQNSGNPMNNMMMGMMSMMQQQMNQVQQQSQQQQGNNNNNFASLMMNFMNASMQAQGGGGAEVELECWCGHKFRVPAWQKDSWVPTFATACQVPTCPNPKFFIEGEGKRMLDEGKGGTPLKSTPVPPKK
jgi:hypothetical protein